MADSGVDRGLKLDPMELAAAKERLAKKFSTHPGIRNAIAGPAQPAERSFARSLPETIGAAGGAIVGGAGGAMAGAPLGPAGVAAGGYAGAVAGAAGGGVLGEQAARYALGEGTM